jgi:hypothetical protein
MASILLPSPPSLCFSPLLFSFFFSFFFSLFLLLPSPDCCSVCHPSVHLRSAAPPLHDSVSPTSADAELFADGSSQIWIEKSRSVIFRQSSTQTRLTTALLDFSASRHRFARSLQPPTRPRVFLTRRRVDLTRRRVTYTRRCPAISRLRLHHRCSRFSAFCCVAVFVAFLLIFVIFFSVVFFLWVTVSLLLFGLLL